MIMLDEKAYHLGEYNSWDSLNWAGFTAPLFRNVFAPSHWDDMLTHDRI